MGERKKGEKKERKRERGREAGRKRKREKERRKKRKKDRERERKKERKPVATSVHTGHHTHTKKTASLKCYCRSQMPVIVFVSQGFSTHTPWGLAKGPAITSLSPLNSKLIKK